MALLKDISQKDTKTIICFSVSLLLMTLFSYVSNDSFTPEAFCNLFNLDLNADGVRQTLYGIIHRLYWHPYAKYPGPQLAKLTDWYAAYFAWKGELHLEMKRVHDEYGSVVRFGPNRLLFRSETALNTIYKSRHVKKSQVYTTTMAANGAWQTFNCIDKSIHARLNKAMRQAMNEEKCKLYEPMWLDHARQFIDLLLTDESTKKPWRWTSPKDVYLHGKVGFGKDLDTQTKQESRYIPEVIHKLMQWNSTYVQSVSLSKLHLDKIFYPQQLYYGSKLLNQAQDFVDRRAETSEKTKTDIYSNLVDFVDPSTGEGLSMAELWAEAKYIIAATADETAAVVSSILFYLSRNPAAYKGVVEEVRSAFLNEADIRSGSAMNSCVFLEACIKESLRMTPPTGGSAWREVEAGESLIVDGEIIPSGCDVGVCIYAVHHNEACFPDSYGFRPERWLRRHPHIDGVCGDGGGSGGGSGGGWSHSSYSDCSQLPGQDLTVAERAWCPFSIGTRMCVAKTMVMMILKDVIALVLWRADLRIPADEALASIGAGSPLDPIPARRRPQEYQVRDHISAQAAGPFLEFRGRA